MTLTSSDIIGLVLSYIYAFSLLLGAEAMGKRRQLPQYVTRKLVHIGAGMWIWGILGLFDSWIYGIIPFATFIVLNGLSYRYRIFKAMDAAYRSSEADAPSEADTSPGTVYFAISITALFVLLWRPDGPIDRVPIAAAAVMAMTWGDGGASIVGQRLGRRHYRIFNHQRSWEGTLAMVVLSWATIFLTLWLLPASAWSAHSVALSAPSAMMIAGVGSVVAALAEAVSPAGTDNLTVPLLTGLALYLFGI